MNLEKILELYVSKNPSSLGELLRDFVFTGEYGGISCFDVKEEFKRVEHCSDLGQKLIALLSDGEDDFLNIEDEPVKFAEEYKDQINLFSNGNIHLGYYWDGDGTLAFALDGTSKAILNTDCKKDYCWEWRPWK